MPIPSVMMRLFSRPSYFACFGPKYNHRADKEGDRSLPIICNTTSCIYCKNGECGLTRAASPGEYTGAKCAYFVKRADVK